MVSMVKWGTKMIREFYVPRGVKQGGINSPDLFSVYLDGQIKSLCDLGLGCHISDLFLASIFFADDICLLAPTRSDLERMISRCSEYCSRYGLTFNSGKSR